MAGGPKQFVDRRAERLIDDGPLLGADLLQQESVIHRQLCPSHLNDLYGVCMAQCLGLFSPLCHTSYSAQQAETGRMGVGRTGYTTGTPRKNPQNPRSAAPASRSGSV